MAKQLKDVLKKLNTFRFDLNYLQELEELVEELQSYEDSYLAIEPIFRFIEAHPDKDLGAPGPLVHWLEQFYKNGYEEQLLDSIKRRATPLSIWMLNRLINAAESKGKNQYTAIMQVVANDESVHPEARNLAVRFLS